MKRCLLFGAVACFALLTVSTAQAKPPGGNSPNAKACQKGGWQTQVRADDSTFASEQACTSYAATGGVLYAATESCLPYTMKATANGDPFASLATCRAYRAANPGKLVSCTRVGTSGDDLIDDVQSGEVVCGFDGNDQVARTPTSPQGYVFAGGIFYGGRGADAVHSGVAGVFNGGDGDDHSGVLSGVFNGGAGNDTTSFVQGGTFNGGDGNDSTPEIFLTGTFNGGAGNDFLRILGSNGFYDGGAGDDTLCTNLSGSNSSFTNIEFVGGCPEIVPPTCSAIFDVNADGYSVVSFTVRDSGSGLAAIVSLQSENATVYIPAFSVGTTDPVSVVGTQISQDDPSRIVFRATDVNGNEAVCDSYF